MHMEHNKHVRGLQTYERERRIIIINVIEKKLGKRIDKMNIVVIRADNICEYDRSCMHGAWSIANSSQKTGTYQYRSRISKNIIIVQEFSDCGGKRLLHPILAPSSAWRELGAARVVGPGPSGLGLFVVAANSLIRSMC